MRDEVRRIALEASGFLDDREGMRKVSLRATDGSVDVSRVARSFGGGGHPQAAGFSTAVPYPELVSQLREHVREQLDGG